MKRGKFMEVNEKQKYNFSVLERMARLLNIKNPFFKNLHYSLKEHPQYEDRIFDYPPTQLLFNQNDERPFMYLHDELSHISKVKGNGGDPSQLKGYVELHFTHPQHYLLESSPDVFDRDGFEFFKANIAKLKKEFPHVDFIVAEDGFYTWNNYCIYYDVDNFIACYDFVYGFVDKIKNMDIDGVPLSNFEKYLAVESIVKHLKYDLEKETESTNLSRSLTGILSSGHICCVGYSIMMNEILNRLGIPTLNIHAGDITSKHSNHTLSCIKLDDDKYGIHGVYFSDVTFAQNSPVFTILSYKEIMQYYKEFEEMELKPSYRNVSAIEEFATFFEEDQDSKEHLLKMIRRLVYENAESYINYLIEQIPSSPVFEHFSKDMQVLEENKKYIYAIMEDSFEILESDFYDSRYNRQLSQQNNSNDMQSVIATARSDIAELLDQCLKEVGDLLKVHWTANQALSSSIKNKFSYEKILDIYKRELNRVLPSADLKSDSPQRLATFHFLIDNLDKEDSVFTPIQKLVKHRDPLWGKTLYGRMQIEKASPLDKNLVQGVARNLSRRLETSILNIDANFEKK